MPIIRKLTGKGLITDTEKVEEQLDTILVDQETIQIAFKAVRDMLVLTNRRLIIVDVHGLMSKKVEYLSIPYKSITHFSVETAGRLDRDFNLKIWLMGHPHPIERKLKKDRVVAHQINRIITKFTTQ